MWFAWVLGAWPVEKLEAELVIGTDGVRSTVRDAMQVEQLGTADGTASMSCVRDESLLDANGRGAAQEGLWI